MEPEPEPVDEQPEQALAELTADILGVLKQHKPVAAEGVDPSLHYRAPHINKQTWTALGDMIAARERSCTVSVAGERWISLRLDGSGFSSAVRSMRRLGILEADGFSARFAGAMVACLRGLMEKFSGSLGFTQSDEMIVFIPPASVIRGEQQPHSRNGRVTKITTLAAGYVTSRFVLELMHMAAERLGAISSRGTLGALSQVLPHFDCRMGSWSSWDEAQALLFWRGWDCSVNGVADAVHHSNIDGRKQAVKMPTGEKLAWLASHDMLPLPPHQAYGTLLAKVKRRVEGKDPRQPDASTVATLRSRIEAVPGPILELAIRDALFPADDVLTGAEAEVVAEAAARKAAAKQAKAEKKAARSEQQ